MARAADLIHGRPLCFQQGVPYTALMELALALVFGLVIGSFLNVVILRVPEGVSITTPRSHCPACRQPIHWYDNIPILSYVLLAGRCRHCKKKISIRYPIIEALTAV